MSLLCNTYKNRNAMNSTRMELYLSTNVIYIIKIHIQASKQPIATGKNCLAPVYNPVVNLP